MIVIPLNEFLDIVTQVIDIRVLIGINLFPLKSLDEALATGIVVRVRRPAHAGNHPVSVKDGHIFP